MNMKPKQAARVAGTPGGPMTVAEAGRLGDQVGGQCKARGSVAARREGGGIVNTAIRTVRRMAIEGRHLHRCHPDPEARAQGWRLMQQARRIARRLGYSLTALGVDV